MASPRFSVLKQTLDTFSLPRAQMSYRWALMWKKQEVWERQFGQGSGTWQWVWYGIALLIAQADGQMEAGVSTRGLLIKANSGFFIRVPPGVGLCVFA